MPPTRQFSPGVIDYNGRMSASYQSGRALSSEAASTWAAVVAPFVDRRTNTKILDLGAGTGRFSWLFARAFEAQVVGIEPSTAMLAVADREAKVKNLAFAAGSGEAIPLRDQSCDLAWLSHVWHHIRDHQACARELQRVVSAGGHVLVRGTFGDQLDGFPTLFRFWPATRQICQQLPTIQQTVVVFEANGFVLAEHRRVQQTTSASLGAFAERTRLRADTALALISDAEFREGQASIEMAVAHEHVPGPVIEGIEFLVFRENSIRTSAA
ncbi:MAG: class I SAM-dependent methyltransferase [Pyrinomonadaceae bacterium]|nr:class I SAM-dependent methyltransferase [Pyrinomonadaceae bacterium]